MLGIKEGLWQRVTLEAAHQFALYSVKSPSTTLKPDVIINNNNLIIHRLKYVSFVLLKLDLKEEQYLID